MEAEAEICVRSFLLSRMNQWFIKGETESITTTTEIESKQIQLYSKGLFSKQRYVLKFQNPEIRSEKRNEFLESIFFSMILK